jgi:2-haloacid dehalogenase
VIGKPGAGMNAPGSAAMTSSPPSSHSAVDTVVFDLGGVLLEWDPRHLYRKIFADPSEMEWFLATVCTPAWNRAQDGGRPWSVAEAEAIARYPAYAQHIRAYRARWPEMLPVSVEGTVAILEALVARGVPLYAITNFAADTFQIARATYPFLDRFRGIVVSGEIEILKPAPGIYHRLLDDHALDAEACLFIDDVAENVDGARAVGMAAIHFQSPRQLANDLAGFGFAGL